MSSLFHAPFACKGDNGCLGIKWMNWKRGFEIFLSAKGITEDALKKKLLLESVGPEVQDIFFTMPESEDTENEQQYDLTMQALDAYFSPKSNTVYERYIFRRLKQQPGESVDQFINKLLEQGKNCKYTDLNDQIRDQVIEKCLSSVLRWNLLEKGDLNLEELQEIAKAFEAMELPINLMEATSAEMPSAGMPSGGMSSKMKIHEKHFSSSPTERGARPEGQRDEQESTFSISEEMDPERVHCNRMHDPAVERVTGFW